MAMRSERRTRRAVCALALLAAVAASAPAAAQRREVKLAVLPVVVHTMEQQAYLRSGLGDMLASRLGQHRRLAVLRMEDPAQATADPEAARAAGRAAGANWVLFGSFTQFGTGASLDLRCLPTAGDSAAGPRSIFTQSGSLGEIIPRLANVAARIAAHIEAGPVVEQREVPDLRVLQGAVETLRSRVEALESAPAPAPVATPAPAPAGIAASGAPPAAAPPAAESPATVAGGETPGEAEPPPREGGPDGESPGIVVGGETPEAAPDGESAGDQLAGERSEGAEGS